MSYLKFTTEASDLLGARKDINAEQALEIIRDKWIDKRKYEDLVNFILTNWDAGNCIEFMLPVTKKLIDDKQFDLYDKLWIKIIKRQIKRFFLQYSNIKNLDYNFEKIRKINCKKFNEFSVKSYKDSKKASSFFLNRLINSLEIWKNELLSVKRDASLVDKIFENIKLLKIPKNDI